MQLDLGEWKQQITQVNKDVSQLRSRLAAANKEAAKLADVFETSANRYAANFNRMAETSRQYIVGMERISLHATVAAKDIQKITAANREMAASLPRAMVTHQRTMDRLAAGSKEAAGGVQRVGQQVSVMSGLMGGSNMSMSGFTARLAGAYGVSVLAFNGFQNLVGILPDAIRLNMDWESAFTGVEKTVNGTEAELRGLNSEIRAMSLEMPIAATKLASIAAVAGQLGIKTPNIAEFTREITKMNVAVDNAISPEELATTFAQWANITRLPQENIKNLAATVSGLGNSTATFERNILDMGQRLASAGSTVRLTDAQITALATSVSQLGFEAELGGTAMTQFLISMSKAVSTGSDELRVFAAVSGETIDSFAAKFRTAPEEAIISFIEGLERLERAQQGISFEILENIGVEGTRGTQVLLGLAQSVDKVRKNFVDADRFFIEGTAHTDEYNKRLDDQREQLQIAANKWVDFKLKMGEALAPSFIEMIDDLTSTLDGMNDALDSANGLLKELASSVGLAANNLPTLWSVAKTTGQILTGTFWGQAARQGISSIIPDTVDASSTPNASAILNERSAYERLQTQAFLNDIYNNRGAESSPGPTRSSGKPEVSPEVQADLDLLESLLGKKGRGRGSGTSELEKLQQQGESLYRSLFPVVDLVKTAQEQTKALNAAGLMSVETLSKLGAALFESFGDKSEDEINRAADAIRGFDTALADAFQNAAVQARQDEGIKFWESIQPPDAQAFDQVTEGIKKLTDAGRIDPNDLTVFADWLYRDVLGNLASESVDVLIQKMITLGREGARTAEEIQRIREESEAQARAASGDQIWAGLGTSRGIAESTSSTLNDALSSDKFLSDPQSAEFFAIDHWNRYGVAGVDAIDAIFDELSARGPEHQAFMENAITLLKEYKAEAEFTELTENITATSRNIAQLGHEFAAIGQDGVSQLLSQLSSVTNLVSGVASGIKLASSAFKILATTAEITGRTIAIDMAEATAGVTLIITAILEAAKAFGLFGDEGQEEVKGVEKLFQELGDAVEEWGQRFTDTITEFLKTGEANFQEFFNSILEDIFKITFQTGFVDPIVSAIQGAFGKGAAFEGGNVVPFAKGGVVDMSNVIPFARGGVVSKPTVFPMAKGMGLMGEAGPEAVMPLQRMPGGDLGVRADGANNIVHVEIIDQRSSGAPVEVEESTGPDGSKVVRAIIRDELDRLVANGSLDRAYERNYGIRRRPQ